MTHANDRLLRLLVRTGEAAGVGGWELDLARNQLVWTDVTREIHGVGPDFVPTVETAIDFYAPEARAPMKKAIETALADGSTWDLELPFIRQPGERIWVRATGQVDFQNGKPKALFGTFRDVSDSVRRNEELEAARSEATEARERLWLAIQALPEAFVLYDREDRAVIFNDRYKNLYNDSQSAIQVGQKFEEILREGLRNGQYPEAFGREDAWLRERLRRHREPDGPIEQELPGDRHLQIHEVRLPSGDTVGFRVDVTQLKRQKKELGQKALALEIAATTDPLTGLNNRRALDSVIKQLAATAPDKDRFGILHIDLDRFKPINDVFGHAAGDHLLCRVSDILRENVRQQDFVARVGGDEFVILLLPLSDEEQAKAVADKIISDCSVPLVWEEKTLKFGASVGIALGPAKTLPTLLNSADIALYEAKNRGRRCHHVFNADLRRRVEEKKALSDEFLLAIERGEILAHYQPQVSAIDGSIVGVEALARWYHPRRGVLAPGVFLQVAEDMGMVKDVDRMVLDHAIETGHRLARLRQPAPKVSVNVSLDRLVNVEPAEWIETATALPFKLCIEILETLDVDRDFDEVSWVLDALRDCGIGVEVDDFGSGRASLTSLLKIRPDRIKLDIQIVRAAFDDPTGAGAMVQAIGKMCDSLGIPMTAEGVETSDHVRLMRDLGCDTLQGFYFARPLARDDLLSWVAHGPTTRRGLSLERQEPSLP